MFEKRVITREALERLKKKFGFENESDREFLRWFKRNHLTGYEKTIAIKEPNGTWTVIDVYP